MDSFHYFSMSFAIAFCPKIFGLLVIGQVDFGLEVGMSPKNCSEVPHTHNSK